MQIQSKSINMKTTAFILLHILCVSLRAQVSGYYINKDNETIEGKVNVKYIPMSDSVNWVKMQDVVEFIGESNKKIKLNPSEIKEVGFEANGTSYKMKTFTGKDFDNGNLYGFSPNDVKFVRVLLEGAINAFMYCRSGNGFNSGANFTVFNKVKTNEWGTLEFGTYKKLGKKLFADCPNAMSNFESNKGIMEFYGCVDFYNKNCQ